MRQQLTSKTTDLIRLISRQLGVNSVQFSAIGAISMTNSMQFRTIQCNFRTFGVSDIALIKSNAKKSPKFEKFAIYKKGFS